MPRRRPKSAKKKDIYWTAQTEQAVVDFKNATSDIERSNIFRNHLYRPLKKMCRIIWLRYFKSRNVNLIEIEEEVIDDAVSYQLFHTFKNFKKRNDTKNKNSAYSYFQMCIRNYYISTGYSNNRTKEKTNNQVPFDVLENGEVKEVENVLYQHNKVEPLTIEDAVEFIKEKARATKDKYDKEIFVSIIQYFKDNSIYNRESLFRWLTEKFHYPDVKAFFKKYFNYVYDYQTIQYKQAKSDNDGYEPNDNWFWDIDFNEEDQKLKNKERTLSKSNLKKKHYAENKDKFREKSARYYQQRKKRKEESVSKDVEESTDRCKKALPSV